MSIKKPDILILIILISVLSCAISCGRYSAPISPERTSPRFIQSFTVTKTSDGLQISWAAPDTNQRGDKLNSLYGYRVYKLDATSGVPDLKDLMLAGTIEDHTLKLLKQKRKEAIEGGKISRKIRLLEEESKIAFNDKDVLANHTYIYKITPYNSIFVELEPDQLLKVILKENGVESQNVENEEFTQISEDDDAVFNKEIEEEEN